MDKNTSFRERLEIGNNKEHYVNDIFNLSGIPSELNNLENVTDMDLYLSSDNMYVDVKYLENSFKESEFYANLKPEDCLIIDKTQLKKYELKRLENDTDTWIAFLINFQEYGIYELRFIKTDKILQLVEEEKAIVRPIKDRGKRKMKINLNRNDCMNMVEFISYLSNNRKRIIC